MRSNGISLRATNGRRARLVPCGWWSTRLRASGREAHRQDDSRERNPANWMLKPNELHERSLHLPLCVASGATSCDCHVVFLLLSSLSLAVLCPSVSAVLPYLCCVQRIWRLASSQANINDSTRQLPTVTDKEHAHSTLYLPSSDPPQPFLFNQCPPKTLLGSVLQAIRLIAGGSDIVISHTFLPCPQDQEDKIDEISNISIARAPTPRTILDVQVNLVYRPAS